MHSKEVRHFAQKIGMFYLAKNKGDVAKTRDQIERAGITSLAIEFRDRGATLIIKTAYPGMLIGKRGENIDALSKYLDILIHIEEDDLTGWLTMACTEEETGPHDWSME